MNKTDDTALRVDIRHPDFCNAPTVCTVAVLQRSFQSQSTFQPGRKYFIHQEKVSAKQPKSNKGWCAFFLRPTLAAICRITKEKGHVLSRIENSDQANAEMLLNKSRAFRSRKNAPVTAA